jgi:hypothetical protein
MLLVLSLFVDADAHAIEVNIIFVPLKRMPCREVRSCVVVLSSAVLTCCVCCLRWRGRARVRVMLRILSASVLFLVFLLTSVMLVFVVRVPGELSAVVVSHFSHTPE